MAYNIPSPWDPGYVLPPNVRDEGLQRRAFVTQWMPRGTYDAPTASTGGYVVPRYVLKDPIGQGVRVTKWQPRGTYNGPAIPYWLNQRPQVVSDRRRPGGGTNVTFSLGADAPLPAPFSTFGDHAASIIMDRMAQLPPAQRKVALKRALDKLDPTLHKRAGDIAREIHGKGAPPAQALRQGLARALSAGMAAEIIRAGQRMGAGPFGEALGDAAAPGQFCWIPATADVPGHWERNRGDGSPCLPGPDGSGVTVRGGGGGVTVTDTQTGQVVTAPPIQEQPPADQPTISILGFQIVLPADGAFQLRVNSPTVLTADQRQLLHNAWSTKSQSTLIPATSAILWPKPGTADPTKNPAWTSYVRPWLDAVAIPDGSPINVDRAFWFSCSFIFKHPKDGKDWCLRTALRRRSDGKDIKHNAVDGPLYLLVQAFKTVDSNWYQKVLATAAKGNVVVGNAVDDVVKTVADVACSLMTSPVAGAGATAAGGAAGAAGAAAAAKTCAKTPPPPVVKPTKSIVPVALLAGGVVLAAAIFSRRQ